MAISLRNYWCPAIKRVIDVGFSAVGLVVSAPFVLLALLLVWLQDFKSPFYFAIRTGKGGRAFKMVKIRSMRADADKVKVWATAKGDSRVTQVGAIIRACKLDEVPQLWNVLKGEMSLVGPRPLAPSETAVFTQAERHILDVTPGITDIASIVFSDEGALLCGSSDADADYDRMIRPWKSRLALLYAAKLGLRLDFVIIVLTAVTIVYRPLALKLLQRVMRSLGADEPLVMVAAGCVPLYPIPPPGEGVADDLAFNFPCRHDKELR